jgi:hypothetical protein
MIGLKNQLHKSIGKNFEIYGGALLGYSSFKREIIDLSNNTKIEIKKDEPSRVNPNAPTGQFLYAGFIGAKVWATPNIGGFVELSSGISILSTGVSLQF